MYAFKSFFLLALPLVAVATPLAVRTDTNPCNTGALQCCDKTEQASNLATDPSLQKLLGLLGAVLDNLDLSHLLGLTCSPITGAGLGGTSCTQQTVCCSGDTLGGGLINLDCLPISISL